MPRIWPRDGIMMYMENNDWLVDWLSVWLIERLTETVTAGFPSSVTREDSRSRWFFFLWCVTVFRKPPQ